MKKYLFSFTLAIAIAAVILVMLLSSDIETIPMTASNGLLDLRGSELSREIISITGGIEHYPELLSEADEPSAILTSEEVSDFGTYRITVLSEPSQPLTLCGYSPSFSSRVFVNGRKVLELGKVSSDPNEWIPRVGFMTIPVFTDENGIAEVIIEYSNFAREENHILQEMFISEPNNIDRLRRENDQRSIAHSASLLAFAMYFTILAVISDQTQYGMLSICCLLLALRDRNFFFVYLLPESYNWYVAFRIMNLTVLLQTPFLLLLLSQLYPQSCKKQNPKAPALQGLWNQKWNIIFLSSIAVIAVLFIFVPISRLDIPRVMIEAITLPYAALLLTTMVKRRKQGIKIHHEDIIALIGFWILMLSQLLERLLKKSHSSIAINGITPAFMLCFVMLIAVSIGIGSRRRDAELEESRRQSMLLERMNVLKNDFLHRLTHEMRTPLTVISGYAQLTERKLTKASSEPQTIEYVKTIASESKRLSELVTNLLDMLNGRAAHIEFKQISVKKLISDIAGICRPMLLKNSNTMTVSCPDGLFIEGNREILIQMFINLASNSNRHTQNGLVDISVIDNDEELLIRLSDTGSGIPPQKAERIFDAGFSLDNGSGLGLSICRDAAEIHGGSLILEATGKNGTVFACRLPKKIKK